MTAASQDSFELPVVGIASKDWFRATEVFLARLPLVPFECLASLEHSSQHSFPVQSQGQVSRRGLVSGVGSIESCVSLQSLQKAVDLPQVTDALEVGAPRLLRVPKSGDAQAERSHGIKLLEQIVRMTMRPNPFGLYAGVALGHFGEHTAIGLRDGGTRSTMSWPSASWLLSFLRTAEREMILEQRGRIRANPYIVHSQRRLKVPQTARSVGLGDSDYASIRRSEKLVSILDAASDWTPTSDLVDSVAPQPGSVKGEQTPSILQLFVRLVDLEVLITDLAVTPIDRDPSLQLLEEFLGPSHVGSARTKDIAEVQNAMSRIVDAETGHIGDALALANDQLLSLHTPEDDGKVTRTDSYVDLAFSQLGPLIRPAMESAASLLVKTSATIAVSPLVEYKRRFGDRYGIAEVPLLDLLDTDRGLGSPYLGHSPPRQGATGPERRRDQSLFRIAALATREQIREVRLSPDDIQDLTRYHEPRDIPITCDFFFSILSESTDDIDKGRFQILIGPRGVTAQGGQVFARFFEGLAGVRDHLQAIADHEKSIDPAAMWAELLHWPKATSGGNVMTRPCVQDWVVDCGWIGEVGSGTKTLALTDLAIGLNNGKFYVVSLRHNTRVMIKTGHLLTSSSAPIAARFLSDLSVDGLVAPTGFDWGEARHLPFLPRLVFERTVLSPARWRVPAQVVELSRKPRAEYQHFESAMELWASQWGLPQHVALAVHDQRLWFDLSCPDFRESFRNSIKGAPPEVWVEETFPELKSMWTLEPANTSAIEFVSTLMRTTHQPVVFKQAATDGVERMVRKARSSAPGERSGFGLGSEWTFMKMYCGDNSQDDLITNELYPLIDQFEKCGLISAWHYLRFADPDPHLRLRVRAKTQGDVQALVSRLGLFGSQMIESSSISRYEFGFYSPEMERYGGSECLPLCEHMFTQSSVLAAQSLEGVRAADDDRKLLNACSTTEEFMKIVGLPLTYRRGLYDTMVNVGLRGDNVDVDLRHRFGRRYRALRTEVEATLAVPDPSEVGTSNNSSRSGQEGAGIPPSTWEQIELLAHENRLVSSVGSILGSLIHLHLNRAGLITTESELEALFCLNRFHKRAVKRLEA